MRSAALIFALLIILSGVAPAAALVPTGVDDGWEPATAAGLVAQRGIAQTTVDDDQPATEIRVELEADTDARWTVTYRYDLADENEVEAFRSLAREYEAGRSDIGLDVGVFRSVADQASESTGRPMQIQDVERNATVERNVTTPRTATGVDTTPDAADTQPVGNATGVVRLSFTWTNFLERNDDGSLELGDVFATTDGGTWLSSLGADQRLTVVTPPGFVISGTSFPIQQQNGSLIIDGPREFASEERLVVTYRPGDEAEIPWMLITTGGVAVAVVLALIGFLVYRGRSAERSAPDGTALTNGGETTATESEGSTSADEVAATPDTTPPAAAGGSNAEPGTVEEPPDDAADEGEEEPDFELLSDEERVEYLLEQRGGRMKQANIVKETGWSDAKVSQLLSAMAEQGRVEKLRLGRENLISLPDETVVEDGRDGE
ncbi:helix-turn-helix transcriptional regulator [Salinigranum marinum]|uniref:helix-turn-helix transcriptional regulator n=1 Tax=Salinigranum marinum TaxID=1515595 RepID=UPI002989C153|nr:hypothetical protein [Salinigranum marinum]